MRVIIAGSTTWECEDSIRLELKTFPLDTIIIHGDAPGADELGGSIGRELGLSVEAFAKNSDDYRKYKRGAWRALNERMLASGADLVLAFHPAVEKSHGTKHLIKLANEGGVTVKIISH